MSRSRLTWIGFFVASSAFAQAGASFTPPDPNTVRVSVTVTNSSGSAIASLQKQDFTVLDNKQPQTITTFEAPSPDRATHVVIVLDAVNIDFTRLAFAREQLDKFLRSENGRLAHPVRLAIFTDSGLSIQPEASEDGNALSAYLDKQEIGLRTSTRSQGVYGAGDRASMSIAALEQLVDFENKQPGQKAVVWISPGWPLLSGPRIQLSGAQTLQIFNTIIKLSTNLQIAGITLYTVDPIGTTEGLRSFYWEQFTKPITAPSQVQLGNLGLQVFAVHTGGRVLMASNDVAGLIEQAVREAGGSYQLTYQAPAPGNKPNEFHSIEIKLDQPHLKAHAIDGYYTNLQPVASNSSGH